MIEQWNNEVVEKEAKAVFTAIMNRNISEGKVVKSFEQKLSDLLEVPYALATPNGTSALALAFMGIGIKPGDEVIVPDITFIATANAAILLGAKVIVADTMEDKPLISFESVMNLITEKTKAVVAVDINGQRACSKELKEALSGRGIAIIDDACQAFLSGGKGNYMGNDAEIACYSFSISKLFTTGQGGLVTTKRHDLYEKMKRIKLQGVDSVFECTNYIENGFNFKLTDILASIGILQLERIQEKITNVNLIYKLYKEGLEGIDGISFLERDEKDIIYNADIMCTSRDKVRNLLEKHEIQVRPNYQGLHTANFLEARDTYKNSKKFINGILYLPSGPNQKIENIEKVIDVIRKYREQII